MPELPEVETARAAIERSALGRAVADVDDHDTYVCRPHSPGEIRAELVGRELTAVHRRGKSIWAETSGDGPTLGIHLGMAGRIYVTAPDGTYDEGGDYLGRLGRTPTSAPVWDRFTLTFADGGALYLFDKRRLGRVRLDPDIDALGPDAATVGLADLRKRLSRSGAPVKARLLDQHAIAGVGNLLADELLWQARVDPAQPADELTAEQVTTLHKAMRATIRRAIRGGGVHTLEVIPFRGRDRHCPRCGAPMQRATIGSRTTWFCSVEQSA